MIKGSKKKVTITNLDRNREKNKKDGLSLCGGYMLSHFFKSLSLSLHLDFLHSYFPRHPFNLQLLVIIQDDI